MTTFDGPNLLITLDNPTAGVLGVDIQRDLYSEWKDWVKIGDNAKYLPAFATSGGEPVTNALDAGSYFFLQNQLGWRIISSDEDQTINYEGNLVAADGTLPIIVPTPGRSVLHLGLQPITQRLSDALLSDVELIRQMLAGRSVISGDDLTVEVYERDGITILQTFSISADGRLRIPT